MKEEIFSAMSPARDIAYHGLENATSRSEDVAVKEEIFSALSPARDIAYHGLENATSHSEDVAGKETQRPVPKTLL